MKQHKNLSDKNLSAGVVFAKVEENCRGVQSVFRGNFKVYAWLKFTTNIGRMKGTLI